MAFIGIEIDIGIEIGLAIEFSVLHTVWIHRCDNSVPHVDFDSDTDPDFDEPPRLPVERKSAGGGIAMGYNTLTRKRGFRRV